MQNSSSMNEGVLSDGLRIFYDQMDERLKPLSPPEQQQYLEGLFHAFDAMFKYANLMQIPPFVREEFIAGARSWAYSKTHHLNLNPETMKESIRTEGHSVADAFIAAAGIQNKLGLPFTFEQRKKLERVVAVAEMDR